MIEDFIREIAHALGNWAYVLVGGMALLETGAFVGFVAPGEFTVILGGVLAGEGTLSVYLLVCIVWACALAGDTISFTLGHKLGRGFLERHGGKVRITPERLQKVDAYFHKHGGKTIVVGRFFGFVRPLLPFLCGSSGMVYRRFLAYDVVGSGAWSICFVVLGYIFWRSFEQLMDILGRSTFVFGSVVVVVVVAVVAVRFLKESANRIRVAGWIRRKAEMPVLRPAATAARAFWTVVRGAWRAVGTPVVRFLVGRARPGGMGLEFTTMMSVWIAASWIFATYADSILGGSGPTWGDRAAVDVAGAVRSSALSTAADVFGTIARPEVVLSIGLLALIWMAWRRMWIEGAVTVAGGVLTVVAVALAQELIVRPVSMHAGGVDVVFGFPSRNAAYSILFVALAVIAWHDYPKAAHRASLLMVGVVLSVLGGLSVVYLGTSYLSDVTSGWCLGLAAFSLCGALGLSFGRLGVTEGARRP